MIGKFYLTEVLNDICISSNTSSNSLYGAAMRHKLPTSDHRWLSKEEVENFDLSKISINSNKGYVLEVDLKYPDHLHMKHNSYPVCSEHITIPESDLSPYAKSCLRELKMKYIPVKKLSATFYPRKKYVCHGLNLQLYLSQGLELEKIHRIVEFHQGEFMKSFVDNCAEKRRTAVTEIDSMIYKRVTNR